MAPYFERLHMIFNNRLALSSLYIPFCILLSFCVSSVSRADDTVGVIPGGFEVSNSGAATYTIPIEVPPGINGLQPKLAITYDSHSGDGSIGHAVNLSGISVISRCPTNIEIDGFIDPVDYDVNDKFCLNGSRLIDIGNNEYRPQSSGNIRVERLGAPTNPVFFKVYQVDGTIEYYGIDSNYGGSNARKQKKNSGLFHSWYLAEKTDLYGNSILYNYENNNNIGILQLESITYSGHEISFSYIQKDKPVTRYIAHNTPFLNNEYSNTITVKSSGVQNRQYTINYTPGATNKLISSVTLCGSDQTKCRDIEFEWTSEGEDKFVDNRIWTSSIGAGWSDGSHYATITYPELNGDGYSDICGRSSSGIYCGISDGEDFTNLKIWTSQFGQYWSAPEHYSTIRYPDLNGDGLSDICARASNGILCGINLGDSFSNPIVWTSAIGAGWSLPQYYSTITYPDLNLDGRADICGRASNGIICGLNNGSGFTNTKVWVSDFGVGWDQPEYFGTISYADVNGDRLPDVCGRASNGIVCAINNGNESFQPITLWTGQFGTGWGYEEYYSTINFVDINQDGMSDVCGRASNGIICGISNGSSFDPTYLWTEDFGVGWNHDQYYSTLRYVDIDSDGLTDLCGRGSDGIRCAMNDGDSFLSSYHWTTQYGVGWGYPEYYGTLTYADVDGDGEIDICGRASNGIRCMTNAESNPKLSKVNLDIGSDVEIEYSRMNTGIHYFTDQNSVWPVIDSNGPRYLVRQVEQSGDNTVPIETSYTYHNERLHATKGLLGFQTLTSKNENTGMLLTTEFSQNFTDRTAGSLIVETQTLSSVELKKTLFDYIAIESNNIVFMGLAASSTTARSLGGSVLSTTTTEKGYSNSWGDSYTYLPTVARTCISSSDYVTSSVVNCANFTDKLKHVDVYYDYFQNEENGSYIPPLLKSEVTVSAILNQPAMPFGKSATETRSIAYDYHYNSARIKSKIIEPSHWELYLKSEYTYNTKGQLITTVLSGSSGTPSIGEKTSTNTYTMVNGQSLLASKSNALGHTETYAYNDNRFPWLATSATGPNNLTTTNHYNTFGELTKVVRPNNTSTETTKEWCSSNTVCASIPNAHFYSKVSSTDTADIYTFYDTLGREIQRYQNRLTSASAYAPLRKTTEYNALGQVSQVSDPFFNASDAIYTTSTYDSLGRPSTATSPDNSQVTFNYNGLTTTKTFIPADGSGGNQISTVVKNALGQNEKTIDNDGNELHFDYDAFGNLVRTTDPQGNTVEIEYDLRGRKIKMDDPDQGIWTYTYYADGKLRTQTDAKNQTTTNTYDLLGRMITRVDGDGTSQWIYDNCAYGKGKLCRVEHNNGYQKTYTYNTLGLADTTVTTIPGQSTLSQQVTYDSSSRVNTVNYPGGFTTQNIYHPHTGTLLEVKNANTNQSLWQANEFNAKGQLSVFKQGELTTTRVYNADTGRLEEQRVMRTGAELTRQNYTWLSNGNLDHKSDHWKNNANNTIDDYYQYDSLNRLTSFQTLVASNQTDYITVDYNELGNIEYKSDVGHYSYNNGRPHAVSNVSSKGNYTYDANGNMTAGDGRTLYYTSFNKPDRIVKGNFDTRIDYGPNRSRYKRQDIKNGSTISTIYYAGAYEKEIKGSTTIERVTLGGHTILEKKNGTQTTYHTIRDHLGSLVATIKSGSSNDTRTSFDPWGKRRTAGLSGDMLNVDDVSVMNSVTQRGFTGHEELVGVGLIHMNGRVFDPVIARFISADPHIQAPNNLQSYNRYSYTLNNPLKYTDPSGYFFKKIFKKIAKGFRTGFDSIQKAWHKNWRTVVAVGLAVWGGWAAYGSMMKGALAAGPLSKGAYIAASAKAGVTAGAASGAIAGSSSTLLHGSSLSEAFNAGIKGAANGAVSGGLFGGITGVYGSTWSLGRVAAHGATGGVTNKLAGGNFNDGFKFAGLTSLARFTYNKTLGYDATWRKGEGLASREGIYIEGEGVPNGPIVFGTNTDPLLYDSSGNMKFFENFWKQGGPLSRAANNIPGMNSLAKLHDHYQISFDQISGGTDTLLRTIGNVPAMLPATAINYSALLSDTSIYSMSISLGDK